MSNLRRNRCINLGIPHKGIVLDEVTTHTYSFKLLLKSNLIFTFLSTDLTILLGSILLTDKERAAPSSRTPVGPQDSKTRATM